MPNLKSNAQLQVEYVQDLPGLAKDQTIELTAPRYVIGRAESCDLCLDDARISRQHTEVVLEGERYYVADCGSINGTFLNGGRLEGRQRYPLKDEDEIGVGSLLVLRFKDFAATVAESRPGRLRRGLSIGKSKDDAYINYKPIDPPLTEQQFRLLALLAKRPGELVTLDEVASAVWPELEGVSDAMIDNLVARLRQRLGRLDPLHDYIERVRGKGLRFMQRK